MLGERMYVNRASIVYGVMIFLSISGVWAVLSIGRRLTAPEDLAGKWSLESRLPSTGAASGAMTVEQSGRFFQIAFENGPQLHMVLDEETANSSELGNGAWHLAFKGADDSDEKVVVLTGPKPSESGVWNARRLVRKFPPDVTNAPATGAH
jgi:hypothetical protein